MLALLFCHCNEQLVRTLWEQVRLCVSLSSAACPEEEACYTGCTGTRLVSFAILDGFRGLGFKKGAEWHERLNLFLMKHNSCVFHILEMTAIVDNLKVKQQHVNVATLQLSNTAAAVTLHHQALLCEEVYSLSTNTLSIGLP